MKELFTAAENGSLTYEQFEAACKNKGIKAVNLADGNYVSKRKYEDDLKAKDTAIDTLKGNLQARDADISKLQDDLKKNNGDAQKAIDLEKQIGEWQTKYKTETDNLNAQLKKQAKEFAVRDFVGTKKFTSNAAKRDFTNYMLAKDPEVQDGKIIGGEDYLAAYTKENADAFVVEQPKNTTKQPSFVNSTNGTESITKSGGEFSFNFTPLHAKKE
ncbi:MAG: phage scaffolding protein [Bacteroidales bacterium]|nr:phage scaffolding protein [Bacteroidales bacterium]